MTEPTNATNRQLPLASTGCSCCAPADPGVTQAGEPLGSAASFASRTYQVEGMTCGHCAGQVTDALTALEGVADVQIDLVAGGLSTITVTGDRSISTEAVRTAVEQAGYSLTKP